MAQIKKTIQSNGVPLVVIAISVARSSIQYAIKNMGRAHSQKQRVYEKMLQRKLLISVISPKIKDWMGIR